jgi:5-methyltetrahydrofolate corrinoid/iron sulfur protein methyltransferase
MDGNDPGTAGLEKELLDYYKTYKVIMGETLYSDSWLEI